MRQVIGEDACGGFGGSLRDLFSNIFSRGGAEGAEHEGPARGSDLEHHMRLGFWDAIRGTQVRFTAARNETCSTCGGTGAGSGKQIIWSMCSGTGKATQQAGTMRFSVTCQQCHGTGKLKQR